MSVSATFEYEPSEHYHALRTITNLTPLRWVTPFCAVVLPALMLGFMVWGARVRGDDMRVAFYGWLPYLLLCFFWAALIPLSQRRRAKKLPVLDASVEGTQERQVDATGFHSRGNGVSVDVPWHAFKKVVETDQFFMFFYNWQCAYYLPKRTLTQDGVADVRGFARAGLGDRARVLA